MSFYFIFFFAHFETDFRGMSRFIFSLTPPLPPSRPHQLHQDRRPLARGLIQAGSNRVVVPPLPPGEHPGGGDDQTILMWKPSLLG